MKTSTFQPDNNFWNHIRRFLRDNPGILEIAAMGVAIADPRTPLHAKLILGGVLAYFLTPLDAVPDMIPIAGMGDDIAMAGAALATLAGLHVTDHHRRSARRLLGAK